jgi:hypothetical protein
MLFELTVLGNINAVEGVTLAATIVVAIATVFYVKLTHDLVKAGTYPCVVVYPEFDGGTHISLVIENVGNGMARDVRFELSRGIPKYAAGLDQDSGHTVEMLTRGPLIDGISALKPGEKRKTVWGQYGGLKNALGDTPVKVTCRFKRLNGPIDGVFDEDLDPVVCWLEVDSFFGTLSIGDRTKDELKKLENRIQKLEERLLK